jgi:hypothetical protein
MITTKLTPNKTNQIDHKSNVLIVDVYSATSMPKEHMTNL